MKLSKFYFLFFNFLIVLLVSTFYFLFSCVQVAEAAVLYLIPQSQKVYQGDSFWVEVRLDSEEEINALEANLSFSSHLLEAVDFSQGGSILSFWPKEPEAKENLISFIGGVPGGFQGEGLVLKINFLAKETGRAKVDFKEGSKVLLNDGIGTLAELIFLEGSYEIVFKSLDLPSISSRTHPDQSKWYQGNTLHLHWDLAEGAEYSFILSQDPLAEPDNIPDEPERKDDLAWIGDMEYPDLEDGIYYFHLKERLPDKDWSGKISFRAMIDSTLPEDFQPEIGQDFSIFEGKYFLSFATTDKTSGINYFEIKEGKKEWKKALSPYLLEDQELKSVIQVKAVDKAGNERIAQWEPSKEPFAWWIVILILIGAGVIWWIAYKIMKSFRLDVNKKP